MLAEATDDAYSLSVLWISRHPNRDLEELADQSGIEPTRTWRAGDPWLRGRFHSDFGFTVVIGYADTPADCADMITCFVQQHRAAIHELNRNLAASTVSVQLGLGVRAVARFISFTPEFMGLLSAAGVELELMACLVQERDDEPGGTQ